jgi:spore coat protein U-like protein
MRRPRLQLPLLLALAWLAPAAARAQSCTFNLGPTNIAFGTYNPSAQSTMNGQFKFKCAAGNLRPRVDLSTSSYAADGWRHLSFSATDKLQYNLFQDSTFNTAWGDGTNGTQSLVNAVPQTTYTIYGLVPAGQWVTPGSYTDTITLTLNY